MAIDESLFLNYPAIQKPVLRIYGWQPAGVSIGYSQKLDSIVDTARCKAVNIPVVRRLTGGTLIFHDNELTYSLICSQKDIGSPVNVKQSYKYICKSLFLFYARFGLEARYSLYEPGRFKTRSGFCFASCQDYDIMIQGKKIGGSAQRRKKNLILQHGSIPLSLDRVKINDFVKEEILQISGKTASLNELTGKKNKFSTIAGILKRSFEKNFSVRLTESNLAESEQIAAKTLEKDKYSKADWNNEAIFSTKTPLAA